MIRGILTGGTLGLVTVTVGLSVASLLAPQPAGNTPPLPPQVDAPADAVPLAEGVDQTAPVDRAVTDAAVEAATMTPQVSDPEPAPGPVLADTASAALPETGMPDTMPTAPDAADATDTGLPATDSPVLPSAPSVAPQVPVPEGDLALSTEPAIPAPVVEVVPEIVADNAPELAEPEESSPDVVADLPDDPVETPTEAVAPEVSTADISEEPEAPVPVLPAEVDAPEPAVIETDVALALATEAVSEGLAIDPASVIPEPVVTGDAPAEPADVADPAAPTSQTGAESGAIRPATIRPEVIAPAPDRSVATMLDMVDVTPPDPSEFNPGVAEADAPEEIAPEEIAREETTPEPTVPESTAPEQASPEPAPQSPAPSDDAPLPAVVARQSDAATLPTLNSGVRVNRIGTEQPVADPATPDAMADDTPDAGLLPEPDGPALVRYAAAFENPDAKPVLSIILIDEGGLANAAIAVGSLPFPVTVAIDPSAAEATARMESYRAAGIEVMALAKLPTGARPTDVEVTFESVFATLPEAIGVLDAGAGGLQSGSAVTDQAMARFAADGFGVVTLDEGLNMAMRAAAAAGVPAATITRDLDGNGQDATVIRRFLDDAAFRARQGSGVVLLGRVRADTLSALTLWGGQNRAAQVAVAPVSAVLTP